MNWTRNKWSNILFSDESRFSVHTDNNPEFLQETGGFNDGGEMVHASTSIEGYIDLYNIRNRALISRRYTNEILILIVVSYAAAIGNIFMSYLHFCQLNLASSHVYKI